MTVDPFVIVDPGDPSAFPVGTRVELLVDFEDHHFFVQGETGTVIRHAASRYLGVIVRLDRPYRCNHGHYEHLVEDFNFSASGLRKLPS